VRDDLKPEKAEITDLAGRIGAIAPPRGRVTSDSRR